MKRVDLYKEAERIAKILAKEYKPEKIILFGSVARGEENEDSDIDLLIIKKSKKVLYKRISEVLHLAKSDAPLGPLVLTPQEFDRRLLQGDFCLADILKEGRVLYAKS